MAISRNDLVNRKFAKRLMGYSPQEVDLLMQEAAEALGVMADERRMLSERVESLERALSEHKSRETTLRDTLMTTQKFVEELKDNARREAELIVNEAQAKAEKCLNEAHSRAAKVFESVNDVKRQRAQFESKLRALIEAHLKLIDQEPELDSEHIEALESNFTFDEPGH